MRSKYITVGVLLVIIVTLVIAIVAKRHNSALVGAASFDACVMAGHSVMESYPRQCRDALGVVHVEEVATPLVTSVPEPTLTESQARTFAQSSAECAAVGSVGMFEAYNTSGATWWYALENSDRDGCRSACVVHDTTQKTEVSWRCTGLMRP